MTLKRRMLAAMMEAGYIVDYALDDEHVENFLPDMDNLIRCLADEDLEIKYVGPGDIK